MVIIEEIGNYPEDDTIIYKQRNEKGIVNRSFTYKIITVGKYPDKKILQVTCAPNCYPIPDDYKIQTKWKRGNENKVIQCIITYQDNKPLYYIQYGENFSEQVFSKSSATNTAGLLHKKFTESNAKTSGILLFGLQLNKLKEYQETKSVKPHTKILKPVNEMTTSGLTKRATKISSKVSEQFSEIANNYYLSEDVPLLKSIEFSVKDKRYDIYYGKENQVLKHKKEVAIVRAMDKSRISRDGYRYLTAIEPNLPKENAISEQKVFINNLMEQNVKIKIINIEATAVVDPDEYTDVPVTLKDKEDKTVTVIGSFVRIDNDETEPMLFFGMTNIRKVQGIPDPNKNQFRIKLHGKAYIIPTFSKAPVVKDPPKKDQDQTSTNSSSPNSEEDLKKSA
ncbi:16513_t:CDS:2 [Rhizophagus irregularis]|nr:16513_t:CDS:2 [Rhizophagus irregularis]